MKKIAFYGGTFDPVHCGHLTVARRLVDLFQLDEFVFVPAFHAPHKAEIKPTSGYHRFAMLTLATANEPNVSVSTIELDMGERRYSVDTLSQLMADFPRDNIFFVMGADSWADIRTWRAWEKLLLLTSHIVVTRPGYEIDLGHVTDAVRERVIDLRGQETVPKEDDGAAHIYLTDAVRIDVSATGIRADITEDDILDNSGAVPPEVAKYIEKYELYR